MESENGQVGMDVGSRGKLERRGSKKGGSGGLVAGVATIVAVGVATKLFQRFNNSRFGSSTTKSPGVHMSLDKIIAKEGADREVVQSGDWETSHFGLSSIEDSGAEENIGCETFPKSISTEKQSQLFQDTEISSSDRESSSEDSTLGVIHVKIPQGKVVPADEDQEVSSTCLMIEPDLAAQTALNEMVHQAVKYDIPSPGNLSIKTKNLQNDIAEVISRAFGDLGCGELTRGELAPTKLKVQVFWEETPQSNSTDLNVFETVASALESGTPVDYDAHAESSEGCRTGSESGLNVHSPTESASDSAASEFVNARGTKPAVVGDELDTGAISAETPIQEIRINPEQHKQDTDDSHQATTAGEVVDLVRPSPSSDLQRKDEAAEDVPALVISVGAISSYSVIPQSSEDLLQAGRDYCARDDSLDMHDGVQGEAKDNLSQNLESQAFHEETGREADITYRECEVSSGSPEEAQITFRECENCSGSPEEVESIVREYENSCSEFPDDVECFIRECEISPTESPEIAEHIARENLTVEVVDISAQEETAEELKQGEPDLLEKFEKSLSSEAEITTPSAAVHGDDADSGTDKGLVRVEAIAAAIAEEKLVVKLTSVIITAEEGDSCEITAAKEIDGEKVIEADYIDQAREVVETAQTALTRGEETTVKIKSSIVLPSTLRNPDNANKNRVNEVADSSNPKKSTILTTMKYNAPTSKGKGGFKQQERSREKLSVEKFRMAILIALMAAMFLYLCEHIKPLNQAS